MAGAHRSPKKKVSKLHNKADSLMAHESPATGKELSYSRLDELAQLDSQLPQASHKTMEMFKRNSQSVEGEDAQHAVVVLEKKPTNIQTIID